MISRDGLTKEEILKEELEEYGEISCESELYCPCCFSKQQDLFEISGAYEDGEHTTICGSCNEKFIFETNVSITYNMKRMEV